MKQKLGLACALIRPPRLLLLDEPSVGVDPISRRELWKMVYDLVDQGIGVVWSTSYLDEAERCARVFLLHEGKVLYEGPPKELTARVEGRSFLVAGAGRAGRQLLARALRRPEIIDGVIQGSSVRLVIKSRSPAAVGERPGRAGRRGQAGAAALRGCLRRLARRQRQGGIAPFRHARATRPRRGSGRAGGRV